MKERRRQILLVQILDNNSTVSPHASRATSWSPVMTSPEQTPFPLVVETGLFVRYYLVNGFTW